MKVPVPYTGRFQARTSIKLSVAIAVIALSLTACLSPAPPAPTYVPAIEPAATAGTSPQKSYWDKKIDQSEPPQTEDTEKSASALHEQHNQDGDAVTSALWQPASPLLKGIAIGDSIADIHRIYGKENSTYRLTEDKETIIVLEYDGFSIGLNDKNAVHFVEIYGKMLPTGLSGIQIGDHPEEAVQELGKPEKQTDYLLTFSAVGALLKLDIDPDQNEIISIKLMSTAAS
ncbi:hypothetical protein [Paenibacillus sp. GXUN7292]|uniref:hypothetical protein n=1 Tax=Paenibacillus sp. GXUN7292 TaxID=3422499 RepID=UPI003D7D39E9